MLVCHLVDKRASLKKKFVRGNHAPFINLEFQKEMYSRSKLRSRYLKQQEKNKIACKKQRNKCIKIRTKNI